jgi:hypothetical protein
LIIKDADYFPIRIRDIHITLQYSGKTETQKLDIDYQAEKQLEFRPLDITFPNEPAKVQINAGITVENKNGRRRELFNSNYSGINLSSLILENLNAPLPYPSNWLAGEIHCHSDYSSNPIEFGAPLEVLQKAAESLGMQYTVSTDHSWDFYYQKDRYMIPVDPQDKWKDYCLEAGSLNRNSASLPLIIPGEEVSCGNHLGQNVHMIVIGHPEFIPGLGDGGRRWFNNRPCKTIPEVLEMVGEAPSFATHPRVPMSWLERLLFRRGSWHEQDIENTGSPNRITGIQFWNGHRNIDYSLGRTFWVQQLLKGHRLLPAAGNDSHGDLNRHTGVKFPLFSLYQSLNHVYGKVRTLVEAPEKTLTAIQSGLRKGNQVCTEGPFLLLESADSRLTVTARSSSDFGGLWKIHLLTVVKSWKLPGSVYQFQESIAIDKPANYFRAEGYTYKDKLAITSPVFL